MCKNFVVSVAVENTAFTFDKAFDYAVPAELQPQCEPGKRVLVPFGRGNRRRQGMILSVGIGGEFDNSLKEIISVLDNEPVMSAPLLDVAEFMRERCFCTAYDAIKTMLPAGGQHGFSLDPLSGKKISVSCLQHTFPGNRKDCI